MALLDEPEADDALLALDRALVEAVRARVAAGPRDRADASAIALRRLQQAWLNRCQPERRAHVLGAGLAVAVIDPDLGHCRLPAGIAGLDRDVAAFLRALSGPMVESR